MQPEPNSSDIFCHVCATGAVALVPGYGSLGRVTSDCKPWPRGGSLGVCPTCGCLQKPTDRAWLADIEQIYAGYTIYHQSGGSEQVVFEQLSGQASSRSARLLERLQANIALPSAGRLLDVGCGNGALLRAFSRQRPGWSLAGTELDDKYRSVVEQIEGVEALYTCAPEHVPGTFDVVTMVHVLEHISGPRDLLSSVWDKLPPDGLLVVEIPDYHQNPFDLLIADHATHFTTTTSSAVLRSAGYEVIAVATDWVPKEQTLVARKAAQRRQPLSSATTSLNSVRSRVEWLEAIVGLARRLATERSFGLFGTSIAATWLFSELESRPGFFVDEDPNRAGKSYMGRPVYHPQAIPPGSDVLIALPTPLAEAIRDRIAGPSSVRFHVPPRLDEHDAATQ